VQFDPSQPWPASWGTPINQEDLLGTLMSFSAAVLHGLKRMGAVISSADADDFIYAWCVIGRGLGIVDTALPHDEASAAALALRIGTRQHRATSEGTALANQLLQAVETLFPIRGYALSLTHYFLADTVFGANVAQVLDLPPPNWTRHIVRLRAAQKRQILRFIDHVPGARTRRRFLAKRFAQSLILLKRPDRASPFEVPSTWLGHWRIDMR
jgi:hypothetical protein